MKANKTVFSIEFEDSSGFKGYYLKKEKDDTVYVYAREIRLVPFDWRKGWGLRITVVDKHENNLIDGDTIRTSHGEHRIWLRTFHYHYGGHEQHEIPFLALLLLSDVYGKAADLIAGRVFGLLLEGGEIDELFEYLPEQYVRLFNKSKQVDSPEEKSEVAEV